MCAIVLPVAVVLGVAGYVLATRVPARFKTPAKPTDKLVLTTFGIGQAAHDQLEPRFSDADGDLVADLPRDPAQCIQPDPIVFSYIAGENAERDAEQWAGFVAHLGQVTGRRIEYLRLSTVEDQLKALQDGSLHVTGFNSGAVPLAVNSGGFVPVCTYGNDAGQFGYRMQIVVPAQSPIKRVEDLRNRRIGFTNLSSNSGFKAAFVLLMSQYQLLPERDYLWAFSGGHQASLEALKVGKYDAAALASDLIEQAVRDQSLDSKALRVVYESERFPPAALGYVHSLEPKLAEQIRAAMLSYSIDGSPLADYFGSNARFLPITYKDDWATIRRIDQLLAQSGNELSDSAPAQQASDGTTGKSAGPQ